MSKTGVSRRAFRHRAVPMCCAVQELLKNWEELPPMLATSSRAGSGKAELLAHIAQLREAFKKAGTL